MATDPGTADYLLDQLGRRRASFTTKRMFGEYCLYRDGLPVALVCDDMLFVKDTPPGREAVSTACTVEFGPPYPGARPHLRLSPDLWDDGEWLAHVLDVTASALPAPKPKAPRRSAKAGPAADAGLAASPTKSGSRRGGPDRSSAAKRTAAPKPGRKAPD